MISKLRNLFSKSEEDTSHQSLPVDEEKCFVLRLENLPVGELNCKNGIWTFKYTKQFIYQADKYYPIVGFPDLHKEYKSESLWPFFLVRIPGLGQPAVKEVISKENIDPTNEAQLLDRFGKNTLANPFTLIRPKLA